MAFSVWQRTIVNAIGVVIPSALVEVRRESDNVLVNLYDNPNGAGAPIGNPTAADLDGFVQFYAAQGVYRITASNGVQTATWRNVQLGRAQSVDSNQNLNTDDAVEFAELTVDSVAINGSTISTATGEDLTISPAGNLIITASVDVTGDLLPSTDDTFDLGSATAQWQDLYIDGTANIDSLIADTADINGGTIDNAVIGGSVPAAATFTSVNADYVDLATNTTLAPADAVGRLRWDQDEAGGTLILGMTGGNVVQPVGEAQYYWVKAASTITKGQVIMAAGVVGASGKIEGAPATGLNKDTGIRVIGIAAENIDVGEFGLVTSFGYVRGINTNAFDPNDVLYLNPSVAGGLTNTIPAAPNAKVIVALVIIKSATIGTLLVRVTHGESFGSFATDAEITGLANNDFLVYDGTDERWENYTAANARTAMGLGTAATSDAGDFATATQGTTADTAVQPGDLATVATSGAYGDLSGLPTLGTAAARDVGTGATDVPDIAAGDGRYGRLGAANTWTENQTLSRSSPVFAINGDAGAERDIRFSSGGVLRWVTRVNSAAESGSNAGSNFLILSRNDAGGDNGAALELNRATLAATFGGAVTATKFIPTGGTATGNGVYLPATNTLALSTAGAERVRVTSAGNVGIGTSAPTFQLQTSADSSFNGVRVGQGLGGVSTSTAVGLQALNSNTTGVGNTAVGNTALRDNTTASFNTAVGVFAIRDNTTGNENTAVGTSALMSNTTGGNNTAVGISALRGNIAGSFNAALGREAGRYFGAGTDANSAATNSVFVGYQSRASADNSTNEIVIGHNAIGAGSNTATLGSTSITQTVLRGTVTASTFKPASYTVATVPSASTLGAGAMIFVSDETGGAVIAFSDGTNWLRCTDRAIIS